MVHPDVPGKLDFYFFSMYLSQDGFYFIQKTYRYKNVPFLAKSVPPPFWAQFWLNFWPCKKFRSGQNSTWISHHLFFSTWTSHYLLLWQIETQSEKLKFGPTASFTQSFFPRENFWVAVKKMKRMPVKKMKNTPEKYKSCPLIFHQTLFLKCFKDKAV